MMPFLTTMMMMRQTFIVASLLWTTSNSATAFSASSPSDSSFALFDRFRVDCPADPSCIYQFDADLVLNNSVNEAGTNVDDALASDDGIWAAVFRSNNNNPSVFVRDDFLGAMRAATSGKEDNDDEQSMVSSVMESADNDKFEPKISGEKPVAIARLRKSNDFEETWVLDSIRCILRKENMDEACDGGSEFTEALSVCIDTLLLHHLKATSASKMPFEGSIRTKATLFSGKILEERGFEPVEELAKDMATHLSAYDSCMEKYAERSVSSVSKSPGARDRALQIISLLGRLDPDKEAAAPLDRNTVNNSDGDSDDEFDPWANMKQFI